MIIFMTLASDTQLLLFTTIILYTRTRSQITLRMRISLVADACIILRAWLSTRTRKYTHAYCIQVQGKYGCSVEQRSATIDLAMEKFSITGNLQQSYCWLWVYAR